MSSPNESAPSIPRPALESHVAFFDTDNDGIISPLDTFKGLRAIGFGIFFSVLFMFAIHSVLSYPTWGTLLPDPSFVSVSPHKSRIYTQTGELDESRFDFVFALYSADHTRLCPSAKGWRLSAGIFGWIAAIFEWGSVYLLLAEDGHVKREDIMML
ncbi:Caleosin [Mycena galopus ATCC 62051]|nr:Caleosin [Mycena galopus ATCC 62051]